jgi:UDPglucose 6-dehydrogenase
MKIGVCGMGFVGSNLYRWFVESNQDVYGYDVDEGRCKVKTFEEILSCEVIFLCLPTPYREGEKGYDLTCLNEILKRINEAERNNLVVIKSTVIPGTTEQMAEKYPNIKMAFVPEFLTEKYAWEDTLHPDTSIFGYTEESFREATDVLGILPEASFERIIPATEAEMVKIARNNYFVNKIVFMNMLYDTCEKIGIDYELVKDALARDRRIRRSHMEIFHQGGRGGGGTCFTKDTPAFRDFVANIIGNDRAAEFIDCYTKINKDLLEESGKDTGRQYGK